MYERLQPHDVATTWPGVFADTDDVQWRRFAESASQQDFCAAWLELQCRIIRDVAGGVVLLGGADEDQPYALAGSWGGHGGSLSHLAEIAERALQERRGLLLKRPAAPDGTRLHHEVAYPLRARGRLYGVVALDLDPRPDEALHEVMRHLQWGAGWMEVLFHRSLSVPDAAAPERLQAVVALLATLVSHDTFHGAAMGLCTALATRFDCDRVSIGFPRRGSVRLEAVSHSARFGGDTNLIRAIDAAMDEAFDQESCIVLPARPGRTALVTRAHAEVLKASGNGAVCSIPLGANGTIVGVLTLERAASQDIDDETIAVCESLAVLVGPMLDIQRRENRWLLTKAFDAAGALVGRLIGPRHVGLKLATAGLLALVLFVTFAEGDYRVTADTVIEPSARQAIVASFDGYVRSAPLRAGDIVTAGQELARLDDRDLLLERARWQSQEEQSRKQYQEALGKSEAAQVQISAAQIDQARAQVALLDEQIARTRIVAPFDGVVVTGDLSQSLGAPVARGDVLFELAPLDAYRVVLQVDERDIADVEAGQSGQLVLAGFASEALPLTIARLTPVSTAAEGRNFFRVEASLARVPERLRPGMEGVGKIVIDRRRLVWIWTHDIVDWVRLKVWYWLP